MAKPNTSYKELRKQTIEDNKKRMEALNLHQLAQAVRTSTLSPKPSPMKRQKKVERQLVEVRRSSRVASQPTPVCREVEVKLPRRSYGGVSKHRDLSNRVYADEDCRAEATEKAEAFELGLGSDYPTFVKPMLQSHVTGGFWMGLPRSFCRKYLPKCDETVTLVDEQGDEYPTVYLGNKHGLSGGWRGFTIAHELVDGDALVFQLIRPTTFKLSTAGGRLIISSDGVWDILSAEEALDCCRGMPPDAAAAQIVKDAVGKKGLRDDTTCIVIDILPQEKPAPPPAPLKKHGKGVLNQLFKKKSSEKSSSVEQEYHQPDTVEEMFEEGSASLSESLDSKYPLCNMFKVFSCAICQVEIKPGEGISIHSGSSSNPEKSRPWDGPFLCASCQEKRELMEGKRRSNRHNCDSD